MRFSPGHFLRLEPFLLQAGFLLPALPQLDQLSVEVGDFDLAVEDHPGAHLGEEDETLLHFRHLAHVDPLKEPSGVPLDNARRSHLLGMDGPLRPLFDEGAVPLLDQAHLVKHLFHFINRGRPESRLSRLKPIAPPFLQLGGRLDHPVLHHDQVLAPKQV